MKKLAFLAEAKHVKHIKAIVRSRQFPSVSAFLRAAVDEKLRRTRQERLNAQVARYCAEDYAVKTAILSQCRHSVAAPGQRTTGRAGDPCRRISRRPDRPRIEAS